MWFECMELWDYRIIYIVVVGADPDQCYISTTNIQMKYEEEDVCEKIVKKQMGIVSWGVSGCAKNNNIMNC